MAAKICAKCGQRTNFPYPFHGQNFCRECFDQLSAEMAAEEDARQPLYKLICEYFGLAEVPVEVIHIVDRELRQGRTVNGLIKTLQYYCNVQGNPPGALNGLRWIWSDYYEAAKQYEIKLNAMRRHNATVDLTPEPNIIHYTGDSIAPPKPRDFGYKLEDLQ